MNATLESDLASFLNDLSVVQERLLKLLSEKRRCLAQGDVERLETMQAEERSVLGKLQSCQHRRSELLAQAAEQGMSYDSIRELTSSLPNEQRGNLDDRVKDAQRRSRLLQHQSLTNWVLVQRSLLHLSQMLEIIATGGRLKPTYGKEPPSQSTGALMDHAV